MPPGTPPGGSRLEQVDTVIKCTPTRVPEKCRRQLDCDRIAVLCAQMSEATVASSSQNLNCSRSCREKEFRPTAEQAAATFTFALPKFAETYPASLGLMLDPT
jgi:hypothetical protein